MPRGDPQQLSLPPPLCFREYCLLLRFACNPLFVILCERRPVCSFLVVPVRDAYHRWVMFGVALWSLDP